MVHGQGTERDCGLEAVFSGFPNVVTLHGVMTEQAKLLHARPGTFYWMAAQLEKFTLPRAGRGFLQFGVYRECCAVTCPQKMASAECPSRSFLSRTDLQRVHLENRFC